MIDYCSFLSLFNIPIDSWDSGPMGTRYLDLRQTWWSPPVDFASFFVILRSQKCFGRLRYIFWLKNICGDAGLKQHGHLRKMHFPKLWSLRLHNAFQDEDKLLGRPMPNATPGPRPQLSPSDSPKPRKRLESHHGIWIHMVILWEFCLIGFFSQYETHHAML